MFGSVVLDVAIGLFFVYVLLSLICSAVRESIESRLKSRALHLERGIRELLRDADSTQLAGKIYQHPLVASLYRGNYVASSGTRAEFKGLGWLWATMWSWLPKVQSTNLPLPVGWIEMRKGAERRAGCNVSEPGWGDSIACAIWPFDWGIVLAAIPGWLITAFAVSFGAPFWFDMLNKMMVVRSTVKPHEKSPEESSEDRQRPPLRQSPAAQAPAQAPTPG